MKKSNTTPEAMTITEAMNRIKDPKINVSGIFTVVKDPFNSKNTQTFSKQKTQAELDLLIANGTLVETNSSYSWGQTFVLAN